MGQNLVHASVLRGHIDGRDSIGTHDGASALWRPYEMQLVIFQPHVPSQKCYNVSTGFYFFTHFAPSFEVIMRIIMVIGRFAQLSEIFIFRKAVTQAKKGNTVMVFTRDDGD